MNHDDAVVFCKSGAQCIIVLYIARQYDSSLEHCQRKDRIILMFAEAGFVCSQNVVARSSKQADKLTVLRISIKDQVEAQVAFPSPGRIGALPDPPRQGVPRSPRTTSGSLRPFPL